MDEKLLVTPAPHLRTRDSSETMMRDTGIALMPALLLSIYFFGLRAAFIIAVAVSSSLLFEHGMLKSRKKVPSKSDYISAGLTGLLLAFCLTSAMPWWAVIIGSAVSIIISKHLFGGLGYNIFNPALVGRAFLLASYPVMMTTWLKPFDAVTGPTPLLLLKEHGVATSLNALFFGNVGGSIGETSAIALLLGGAYLLFRGTINWRIPISYLGTAMILAFFLKADPLFHLLSGGLLLGAIFMATDPVTTPVTKMGGWIFGVGCGVITISIRLFGGYPEGVCYAILVMNAATPLIDRYVGGFKFGVKKR